MENEKDLCIAILMQTVSDWRWLIDNKKYLDKERLGEKPNAHNEVTFSEIRGFLNSEYGEYICECAGTQSKTVKKALEDDLRRAMGGESLNKTRIKIHQAKKSDGGVDNG